MTAGTTSADNDILVSRNAARNALRNAIRLYVGRGRRYSVKQLSNATGVKDRVIECAMADPDSPDYREPELAAIMSITTFLGETFGSEWVSVAGMGMFRLPDVDDTPPSELAAENAEDNAAIARAAIDNEFDRTERAHLRPVGIRLMTRGAQLAFAGRAA